MRTERRVGRTTGFAVRAAVLVSVVALGSHATATTTTPPPQEPPTEMSALVDLHNNTNDAGCHTATSGGASITSSATVTANTGISADDLTPMSDEFNNSAALSQWQRSY